jgi:hypothetical protein
MLLLVVVVALRVLSLQALQALVMLHQAASRGSPTSMRRCP